jgi:hypothetical protein
MTAVHESGDTVFNYVRSPAYKVNMDSFVSTKREGIPVLMIDAMMFNPFTSETH